MGGLAGHTRSGAGAGTSSAWHRAWRLGTGGTSSRANSEEKSSPPFLRRKDPGDCHAIPSAPK